MTWILLALLNPLLHGWANIIDAYLSGRLFTKLTALTFFTAFTNVLFLPVVFLFARPELPSLNLLPAIIAIAFIEVLYLYPYYKALQRGDTSIIASLFAVGKVFVPIFAYFIVGEVLTITQYLGFFVIIACSALLSFERSAKFKMNSSFYYMLACSVLLSIEAVLYKYIFNDTNWSTGFVWPVIFSFVLVVFLLLIPSYRRDVFTHISVFRKNFRLFALEEFLTFGGVAASTYVVSFIPVTLEQSIGSFQPIFILAYALLFKRFFPNVFREEINTQSLIKKGFLFLLMIVGVLLVIGIGN